MSTSTDKEEIKRLQGELKEAHLLNGELTLQLASTPSLIEALAGLCVVGLFIGYFFTQFTSAYNGTRGV